jgi:sensor histidine kinase YesM
MNTLLTTFSAFLLLFIFISGGVNKIINFRGTVDFLKTKINAIQLNPIFIAAVSVAIIYFYVNLNVSTNAMNTPLFILISIALISIPVLAYFKQALNASKRMVSFIYDSAIVGVIGLLTLGSLLILYSLYVNKYEEYAYIATIGLAAFTAMTILIFHFPTDPSEMISFTKNLSIFGGLMLLSQRFIR